MFIENHSPYANLMIQSATYGTFRPIRVPIMSDQNLEYTETLDTLKEVIKAKGLRYKDIAEKAGIPESSLKKIFTGRDCSFMRLIQICNSINIKLKDIFDIRSESEDNIYRFTDEQEQYFCEFLDSYKLFVKINSGKSLSDSSKELGLDSNITRTYLKDLEKIGLIERQPGDKIKFKVNGTIKIDENSRLHDKIVEKVATSFIMELPKIRKSKAQSIYEIGSVRASPETIKEFIYNVQVAYNLFDAKSQKENKFLPPDGLRHLTYLLAIAEYDSIGK